MSERQGRSGGSDYPCATLDAALSQLRWPPAPGAVRFKIQNTTDAAAQVASYVDARLVFDRLDHVCGGRWWATFEPLPKALVPPPVDDDGQLLSHPPVFVRCRLTVFDVTRQDVGDGHDPKAAFSDAVKRAAVQFGIGRALYAMRLPWLNAGDQDGQLRRNKRGRLILDQRTEQWCRSQYERWIEHRGARLFGQPLDHGGIEAPRFAAPVELQPSGGHRPLTRAHAEQPPVLRVVDAKHVPEEELRARVDRWRDRGRFTQETVCGLAGFLLRQPDIARLGKTQLGHLAWQLELAAKSKVTDAALAREVGKGEAAADRAAALSDFTDRRIREAQEVGLLGRHPESEAA